MDSRPTKAAFETNAAMAAAAAHSDAVAVAAGEEDGEDGDGVAPDARDCHEFVNEVVAAAVEDAAGSRIAEDDGGEDGVR